MTIKQLLRKEIQEEIKNLEGVDKGSDSYKVMVDGITKLTDRLIDLEKNEVEREDKEEKRKEAQAQAEFERDLKQRQADEAKEQAEFEQNLKLRQADEANAQAEFEKNLKLKLAEDERKDRKIKNCITVGGIVLPIIVTIWGTYKTFEFEREGTVTTILGRGFFGKLLPKK